jgi:DNA-binding LacI/PurR family transcriptional regulator
MASLKELKAVKSQPGRPLYMAVRDAVREAIDAGIFQPGEQMPSTKELSDQLEVSLVTTHRALQELVTNGVLQRSQGKGTFVHERYKDRKRTISDVRLGLIFHHEASLGDFHHSQIFEGIRQAAQQLAVDLVLLRWGEDVRNECNGFLFVNPSPQEIDTFVAQARRKPTLVAGAKSHHKQVPAIDVDNVDLSRQAVNHLADLGHTGIGYVGGDERIASSRDRWDGFLSAAQQRNTTPRDQHVIRALSWRLDERERMALIRALSSPTRPSAIVAAGYYYALDVYSAAATVGLQIPEDLSVVGVDDPLSAAFLAPPLTTLRQPLVQLGHASVTALFEQIQNDQPDVESRTLAAELVIRRSTAGARGQ